MYLLSSAGNFDCRVTLGKFDAAIACGSSMLTPTLAQTRRVRFTTLPGRQTRKSLESFTVVSRDSTPDCCILFADISLSVMPAKSTLFDQRVNVVHDFGTLPRNFISFSPHGRLVCVAGFGNLAGTIDIWDRKVLKKVATIDAPNSSHCEWSPDGLFLLTATLSPRLRVDNGIKIWHHSGELMHVQMIEELYQASWRPGHEDEYPALKAALGPAPAPSSSVTERHAVEIPSECQSHPITMIDPLTVLPSQSPRLLVLTDLPMPVVRRLLLTSSVKTKVVRHRSPTMEEPRPQRAV